MAVPGRVYAYDADGNQLIWDPIKPPPGWRWCSASPGFPLHYKPDDGAPCPYCGTHPEAEAEAVYDDIEDVAPQWNRPQTKHASG